MSDSRNSPDHVRRSSWADADVIAFAVKISVWGRWCIWVAALVQLVYRPGFWFPDDIEYLFSNVVLLAINGVVHWRLARVGTVSWRWMAALSAADLVLITVGVIIGDGFGSYVFLAYYPALGGFALVFSSPWLAAAWTTMAAAVYSAVCWSTGPGLDIEAGQEKVLLARVTVMYIVAVAISVIIRFERAQRQAALTRERQLQQERRELSQAIHDTTAQTAYMIGLGIDGAIERAGDADPVLAEQLAATSTLAKSAMWELRSPIDSGLIFEGRELGRVLQSHTATFATITSVPAGMNQVGEEPPLPIQTRTRLFSIAHNALANAFIHAEATQVHVTLEFDADRVRLSVADDGIGLPMDFRERGRGFAGMKADATRLGGTLWMGTNGPHGGTLVMCSVPLGHGLLEGGADAAEGNGSSDRRGRPPHYENGTSRRLGE